MLDVDGEKVVSAFFFPEGGDGGGSIHPVVHREYFLRYYRHVPSRVGKGSGGLMKGKYNTPQTDRLHYVVHHLPPLRDISVVQDF